MFVPHSYDKGVHQPWEYIEAAAGSYEIGQLLNTSDGKLTAIGAASATTPAYVSMACKTLEDGELLPVQKVTGDVIFETTLSEAADAAVVGSKLRVSAGGLQADAGDAGTFVLSYIDGKAAGDIVRGRFI